MFRIKGKGHVYKLDRRNKALMIEAVLADHLGRTPSGLKILDIGCGNGDISQYFSKQNEQYGVDIADRRKPENTGFAFSLVASERLPQENAFFDIVISHQVIEHVNDQMLHLAEIHRVLKKNGIAYLATPNKSSPIMSGHIGNNLVLRHGQMHPLFKHAGFSVKEYSVDVIKSPHRFHAEIRNLFLVPRWVLSMLRIWFPSHIFILTKKRLTDAVRKAA